MPGRLLIALFALALAGCAALSEPAPAAPDPRPLLRDAAFAPRAADPGDLFALSESMRRFAAEYLTGVRLQGDPRRALVDQLYHRQRLALAYDASRTRSAAEAFDARAGNCLSLVVMTAAFAKALDLPVRFQRVLVEPSLDRRGDLVVASGHVNIALERSLSDRSVSPMTDPSLVVDFLPGAEIGRQRVQSIGEDMVVAMYLNNRAAEALADDDLDAAYAWARAAVLREPVFTAAWNTLGVVYLRRGLAADATRVFDAVLARESENVHALSNLVGALRRQGRTAEADAAAARLAAVEPLPPFHFFDAGLRAMAERDFERARELFSRELRRDASNAQFHLWLARAELALGHTAQAQRQLERALRTSATAGEQAAYAAKLDWLRATYR